MIFLTIWIQKNALNSALHEVRERHLLVAKNLTNALSRYVTDFEAAFVDMSSSLDNYHAEEHQTLMSTIGIDLLVSIDANNRIGRLHHGSQELLPERPITEFLSQPSWRPLTESEISGVQFNRQGNPTLFLRRPTGNGGWILASLNTEYIIEVQKAVSFGDKGHAAIIDHRGWVLAHPNANWQRQMKDISALSPAQAMMAGETGVIEFFSPAMEAQMVAGHTTVPLTGWGVMIPQPRSELERQARQYQRIAMIVAAIGLALAWFLGWRLSRSISHPIGLVTEASSLLVGNKWGQQARLPKGLIALELETLYNSFNRMTEQLNESRDTLEKRVKDRTQALEAEISRRKMLEENYRYMATHDELTDLPNRNLLMDRVTKALQHGRREGHKTALLFIDLDGFKQINDKLGHIAGDYLLEQTARRLTESVRDADTVCRYGGDEFVILLVDAGEIEDIERLTQKILDRLVEPIALYGQQTTISATIGVALTEGDISPDDLIHQADAAMYRAKKAGKKQFTITQAVSAQA